MSLTLLSALSLHAPAGRQLAPMQPPVVGQLSVPHLAPVAARERMRLTALAAADRAPPPVAKAADDWILDPQRWTQLTLLSLLALLSDWVCFSTAAVPGEWMSIEGHEASQLIDIFLCANVVSCFLYTDIAANFGLRRVIIGAAWLMTAGCIIRSGAPFGLAFASANELSRTMPGYTAEVLGTILVGAAQPFFQCSPPLLSATWFGSSERALATATAINFNQVGIATAFIIGGSMATTPAGMHAYFDVVTCAAFTVAVATLLLFRERPETPPSASAAAAWAAEDAAQARREQADAGGFSLRKLTYPGKAIALLRAPGFLYPLAAFVASIGCTNVVSTFTAPELARAGLQEGFGIDLAGAGFQFAIVLGGIALGRFVDETKQYKAVTLTCLGVATSALFVLGVGEGQLRSFSPATIVLLLFALGATAGPVQPISAELAVEVAYPCDENAVEATQQLSGNLFSALLVPICAGATSFDLTLGGLRADVEGDTLVLLALLGLTAGYFIGFDAPLKRTMLDET